MITKEKIKELEVALDVATKARDEAAKKLNDAKDKFAQQACQHKVGDIIDCGGWSHKGKKMIVDRISRPGWSSAGWRVFGRVLRKDSSVGNVHYDFEGGKNEL